VLHVAIVGAGATGVELCAELSQLLDAAASYGDPNIRRRLRLTLLESGPRILPAFPESVSNSTAEQLKKIGVDVRVNVRVVTAEAGGFRLADDSLIAAQIMVWAAGVKAARFLERIGGLETGRGNQLLVRPTLQTTLDDNIFAVGDCASFTPPGDTRPLGPTAQVAHQQAMHLSRHFSDWLEGKPMPAFRYRDFGSLVSLGEYNAFGTLGRFGFFKGGFIRGRFAQLSHAMLYRRHQLVLHGFFKSMMLWAAERLNALVRPKIRLS
jgi:NADH dehydrogenase